MSSNRLEKSKSNNRLKKSKEREELFHPQITPSGLSLNPSGSIFLQNLAHVEPKQAKVMKVDKIKAAGNSLNLLRRRRRHDKSIGNL